MTPPKVTVEMKKIAWERFRDSVMSFEQFQEWELEQKKIRAAKSKV